MSIDPDYCGLYTNRQHMWDYRTHPNRCACGAVRKAPKQIQAPDGRYEEYEPQEGASSKGASEVDRTAPVGDVSSCDSELAVCRRQVAYRCADWTTADTLLCMVEELTAELEERAAQLADETECRTSAERCWAQERTLREELEAKLALAQKDLDKEYVAHGKTCEKLADMTRRWTEQAATIARHQEKELELEAKLAEADRQVGALSVYGNKLNDRAEAAEARVESLETERDAARQLACWLDEFCDPNELAVERLVCESWRKR